MSEVKKLSNMEVLGTLTSIAYKQLHNVDLTEKEREYLELSIHILKKIRKKNKKSFLKKIKDKLNDFKTKLYNRLFRRTV